jgi:hypothetical protein
VRATLNSAESSTCCQTEKPQQSRPGWRLTLALPWFRAIGEPDTAMPRAGQRHKPHRSQTAGISWKMPAPRS